MANLIVTENPELWKEPIEGATIVSAKEYLSDENYTKGRFRIFNVCQSYRYQSFGYYVSLLSEARKHTIIPTTKTVLEMKALSARLILSDLDDALQKCLAPFNDSTNITLSIYFGKTATPGHEKLAKLIFGLFQAPLVKAQFQKKEKWYLQSIASLPTRDISADEWPQVTTFTRDYFKRASPKVSRKTSKFDLAILVNESEETPPSDKKAIKKFIDAGIDQGFYVEQISKEDFSLLPQFDALFIRETTSVNHHTFRFAQRAETEGLVVVDSADSILKCTNKIFLFELLKRQKINAPGTTILSKETAQAIAKTASYPCILKQPDSYFSLGVTKADNHDEFIEKSKRLFESSELILMQEFVPTDFDWRVGILDNQPLYVCKYFMAKSHWQIMNWKTKGMKRFGNVETLRVEEAPAGVIQIALKAAKHIGDGLYGVDVKTVNGKPVVIEVNDNPSIEQGVEDIVLKDQLYESVMKYFMKKIEERIRS